MAKLRAWLRPNLLTKDDKSDFMAVPVSAGSLTVEDIIKELRAEGMEIKTETAHDIISRFNRVVSEKVLEGYSVNTGLVYMRPAIKGVFYDKSFDKDKHSVYVAMNQGTELRKATAETKVEILGEQASPMSLFNITDKATGNTDGTLTKGKNAEIKGTYIKVEGSDPKNGIIFKNLDNSQETKLPMENIVLNEPSRLLILVPADLASGNYEVSVLTQYAKGGTQVKEPRVGVLATTVVIV